MNKQKLPLRLYGLILATVFFLPLSMADPAGDPAEPQPASEPTLQTSTDETQVQNSANQVPVKQVPAKQRPAKQVPIDKTAGFKPTEKIGADSSVSFPVDI